MRILLNYLVSVFVLAAFSSCTNHEATSPSSNDAYRILESAKRKGDTLKFWDLHTRGSGIFLTGVYKNQNRSRIGVYTRNTSGSWSAEHSDSLLNVAEFNKIEWTVAAKQTWLYLDYNQSVTGLVKKDGNKKTAVFSLFQPQTGELLKLRYESDRHGNTMQGNFNRQDLDSLKEHPVQLALLKKLAGLSGLIPSEDKKNTRPGADSALKKWAMLNEGVYDALKERDAKAVQLNIEEYSSDISPGPEDFDNDTLVFKLNTLVIQNAQYKAVSVIKGPVYILNKAAGKSFIIWAPPESKSWIHKMVFRKGASLMIYPTDSASQNIQAYELDLAQKTIRPVLRHIAIKQVKKGKTGNHRQKSRKAIPRHPVKPRSEKKTHRRRHRR